MLIRRSIALDGSRESIEYPRGMLVKNVSAFIKPITLTGSRARTSRQTRTRASSGHRVAPSARNSERRFPRTTRSVVRLRAIAGGDPQQTTRKALRSYDTFDRRMWPCATTQAN